MIDSETKNDLIKCVERAVRLELNPRDPGTWRSVFILEMCPFETKAFDQWLVDMDHELAQQPGLASDRFRCYVLKCCEEPWTIPLPDDPNCHVRDVFHICASSEDHSRLCWMLLNHESLEISPLDVCRMAVELGHRVGLDSMGNAVIYLTDGNTIWINAVLMDDVIGNLNPQIRKS